MEGGENKSIATKNAGKSMAIIIFGLPLTYAYATLRQSVAGNSRFRGFVFCNLSTP